MQGKEGKEEEIDGFFFLPISPKLIVVKRERRLGVHASTHFIFFL
jgi:hypothetical protein